MVWLVSKMGFLKFFGVYFSCLVAVISSTKLSSCSGSSGLFPSANYSSNSLICESTPCDCYLGCPALISVDFKAPRYLENLTPHIHATCLGVALDYPLYQDNACDGITNTQCPIVENESVNYQYSLSLLNVFPEVTVTLRFTIIDNDTNEDVLCFEFDINVLKDRECPP